MTRSTRKPPGRVAVIGAGMVGLSTAWFLQEAGVEVTVLDRSGVAAGSSWGNAGWLTSSLAAPLPEPAVLKYGIRAMFSPSSPLYIPPTADPRMLKWLAQFARNCTSSRRDKAMQGMLPLIEGALPAFDALENGGVTARTQSADPLTAAFRTAQDSKGLLEEFAHLRATGRPVDFEILDGAEAGNSEPVLADEITRVVRLHGERFIDPAQYVRAIADSVRARGGLIVERAEVHAIHRAGASVTVAGEDYDAVVLAHGAWINRLARQTGVRQIVQAGRGYSFTVKMDQLPKGPVYFTQQKLVCTPLGDRARIAGTMEFRDVSAPKDPRRIQSLVAQARTLLRGAHLDDRQDEWVGARPCTADGLPLIGAGSDSRVYVAGGHGMWGIFLGPVSGRLLAEQIATGQRPEALRAVDPLR
ncbi:FAD-binding oxidoreductase [Streptomyces sp. VRA16 Mangrove soil]|uniref:NAD(P)/FAD-dependent oxidoreductase n=1 Tax=Streptomyces sp. VRA16 Mangrove soil TaxID=2817434 RepID=UPI001A9EF541|nr:FAD-dependent oxidoreductase [Streptomyces sp. VRA16 Mangrove soil]MBO1330443.1 FAD-dependent oxidoreductase [Streptomyces sp. VRA16 Mangrove soil]